MRCTHCLFYLDNGVVMVMWIGHQVPNETINDIFSVTSHSQIDTHTVSYTAGMSPKQEEHSVYF